MQGADLCSLIAGSDLETALVGLCNLSINTSVMAFGEKTKEVIENRKRIRLVFRDSLRIRKHDVNMYVAFTRNPRTTFED